MNFSFFSKMFRRRKPESATGIPWPKTYRCVNCGEAIEEKELKANTVWEGELPKKAYRRAVTKCPACGFRWEFFHGVMARDCWDEIEWPTRDGRWTGHVQGCLSVFGESQ